MVAGAPVGRHATDLVQDFQDLPVEPGLAVGSVEAFDAMTVTLFLELVADQLRPPLSMREALGLPQISISSISARTMPHGQARVYRDAQRLAVEIVDHLKRADAMSRP